MTCPYCSIRPALKATCGDRRCQQAHHCALERQRQERHRDTINAARRERWQARKDTGICLVCSAPFTPRVRAQQLCGKPACRSHMREMKRRVRRLARTAVHHVDLSAEQIDAKLAALAAHRKATRSWLRIEDPWQQRRGSELHHMAGGDLSTDGALL